EPVRRRAPRAARGHPLGRGRSGHETHRVADDAEPAPGERRGTTPKCEGVPARGVAAPARPGQALTPGPGASEVRVTGPASRGALQLLGLGWVVLLAILLVFGALILFELAFHRPQSPEAKESVPAVAPRAPAPAESRLEEPAQAAVREPAASAGAPSAPPP